MLVRLYGATQITVGGQARSVGVAKERAVLALLATRIGEVVAPDVLLEAFWTGQPPEKAIRSLQVRIANLRRVLDGSGVDLLSEPGGYRLAVDRDDVDLYRFRSLVAAARACHGNERLDLLDEAFELRTGSPLAEFGYDDFARHEIEADAEARQEAVGLRAASLVDLGRSIEATTDLVAEFESAPHREPLATHLMRAFALAGRVPDALDVFRRHASALAERGLEPSPEVTAVEEAVLLERIESLTAPSGNLPHRPSLVGRAADRSRVTERLREQRMVTVVGPPGVGKTTLAIASAHDLADTGGVVVLVDLTVADDIAAAVETIAGAVGAPRRDLESMRTRLGGHGITLLLDNVEHLVPEIAATVREILDSNAALNVLATSRVPLGVPGEYRLPLDPLRVPARDATPDEVEAAPAVQLFVARSGAVRGGYSLNDDDLDAVADLCRALDGLPLAIELAASRMAVLSPHQIRARLVDSIGLLADVVGGGPQHHRTAQAAIEWSTGLLSPDARDLLGALSVFHGGFDLGGAEVVAAPPLDPDDVVHCLDELVAHSLLLVDHDADPPRYRMLESIAEVARGLLTTVQREGAERRHRSYIHDLVRDVLGDAESVPPRGDLSRLDAEAANLRRAIIGAVDTHPQEAAALLADSAHWWRRSGHWKEGAELAERLLRHAVPADPALCLRFYRAANFLILFGPDNENLLTYLDEADGLAHRLGEEPDLRTRALALRVGGRLDEAVALHEQDAHQARAAGRSARTQFANIAEAKMLQGELAAARVAAERARREAEIHGEGDVDTSIVTLARLDLLEGRFDEAAKAADEWIRRSRTGQGDRGFVASAMLVRVVAEVRRRRIDEARNQVTHMLRLCAGLSGIYGHAALVVSGLLAFELGDAALGCQLLGGAERLRSGRPSTWLQEITEEVEQRATALGLDVEAEVELGRSRSIVETLRLAHSLATPR